MAPLNSSTLPLFMKEYTKVKDSESEPHEGIDYIYNYETDCAEWINSGWISTKCSTASRGKVDDSKYDD